MEHYKRLCLSGIISLRWYTFKLINKNNLLSWVFLIFYLICLLSSWSLEDGGGGVIFQNSRVSEKTWFPKHMQKLLYFISLMWIYHIFFFKLTTLHFAALSNLYSIFRWFLSQTGYFNPFGWLVWTRAVAIYTVIILYQFTGTCIYLCVRSL